jgi:uncharacterized protein with HEPN domain
MLESDKKSIEEALFSLERIKKFLKVAHNKDIFTNNQMAHDAILLQFIVLGESCGKISLELKKANPHIDWRGTNDFRNFLAHDYFGVSDDVVWSVIQFHLPQLEKDLENLLQEN